MKIAKFIAILGIIAMTGIITYAFAQGDFAKEGAKLVAMPWGIVSLVDLYTGFTLFSGWIIFREKSPVAAALWVVLMMGLGFFTGSLYVLIALFTSKGDWKRFWMGHRA
ncbi:MAG: DUF1475 domain-containing protein [Chloroflexi bacterium]|nr:MAG: DUF1475 domain-containing protein [Chloroflexota bacterium]